MKSPVLINKILDSSTLSAGIFIASGCYRTYKDYKTANSNYKDRFLVKDCVVLSGAALGMFLNQAASNKITNSKFYNSAIKNISQKVNSSTIKNGIKTSLQHTTEIVKDLSSGMLSTASGIAGALCADYFLSKTSFKQPKYVPSEPEKTKLHLYIENNLDKIADEKTKNALYTSISDLPKIKVLSSGMIGADAIEIAQNKELDKKLKYTTEYLVNDTLLPLIFLTTSTSLTKTMKPFKRISIIFLSLFLGTLLMQKLLDKLIKNK